MPRKNIPVPVPPGSKYCHGCNSVRSLSGFHNNRSQPDGLASQCKECARAGRQKADDLRKLVEDVGEEMREYFRNRPEQPFEEVVRPMSVPNR